MTPPPSTRPSIRIRVTFGYRGGTKEWSTRWHFAGNLTPSDAQFAAASVWLRDQIKYLLPASATIVGAVGYHPGSEVPVWSAAYSVAGVCDLAATDRSCPGDCAFTIRWLTDQRTSKNHPIYLFNYFHGAFHTDGQPDTLSSEQHAVAAAIGTRAIDGTWTDGATALHRCGPYGAVGQSASASTLITHRDFPR